MSFGIELNNCTQIFLQIFLALWQFRTMTLSMEHKMENVLIIISTPSSFSLTQLPSLDPPNPSDRSNVVIKKWGAKKKKRNIGEMQKYYILNLVQLTTSVFKNSFWRPPLFVCEVYLFIHFIPCILTERNCEIV